MVSVNDVRQVTVSGGCCHSTPVGRPFCMTVNTETAGDSELVAKIAGQLFFVLVSFSVKFLNITIY